MLPSWIGVLIILVGTGILLRGSIVTMLMFQMTCSLMGGSAALFLPALGGSSVPPSYLALCFMIARLTLPGADRGRDMIAVIAPNKWLFVFVLYGVLTAPLLPRLFAGTMNVVPLRAGRLDFLLQTFPLAVTSQNITTAIYLTGTLFAGLAAGVVGTQKSAPVTLVKWGAVIASIHVFLGVLGALIDRTPAAIFLNIFRNGSYAQLDQTYDGMSRIKGIMPEPSSYAAFAFMWFVFHFECWIRDVAPRWSGAAAGALGAILVFSTSSTAYVAIGGYVVILALRCLVFSNSISLSKLLQIALVCWAIFVIVAIIMAASPHTATRFATMIENFTVNKADSHSGIQRAFWAKQGLEAFMVSKGIGIGAGSFRSSSIFSAILGSMGLVGILAFTAHVWNVLQPTRQSTYVSPPDDRSKVGVAAAWTGFMLLIPSGIGAASPNPGADFAIFCSLALVFRAKTAHGTVRRRIKATVGLGRCGTDEQPVGQDLAGRNAFAP